MSTLDPDLRFLSAAQVDTPVGRLDGTLVVSPSHQTLGRLDGVLVDPGERRVRYLVMTSGRWFGRHRHLLPLEFAQIDADSHAVQVGVEPDALDASTEWRGDLPAFSDEDLITAIFSPSRHA